MSSTSIVVIVFCLGIAGAVLINDMLERIALRQKRREQHDS